MDTENTTPEVLIQSGTPAKSYPVDLEIAYPEKSSRILALLSLLFFIPKIALLIPHFVVLYFVQIIAFVAWVIAQVVVLFTGKYPRSFFNFIVGASRWQARVGAFMMGLTDKYPPFRLEK